jgi:hypothetical protein
MNRINENLPLSFRKKKVEQRKPMSAPGSSPLRDLVPYSLLPRSEKVEQRKPVFKWPSAI